MRNWSLFYINSSEHCIKIDFKFFPLTNSTGTINVTYATVTGLLSVSNQTEPTLAEPGDDYIPTSGSLILEEGETSAAINITILEVSYKIFRSILQQRNSLETKAWRLYITGSYVLISLSFRKMVSVLILRTQDNKQSQKSATPVHKWNKAVSLKLY